MSLKNQKGFVVMTTVIMISAIVLISIAMGYIYTLNRIRYHARIKEAYKIMNATESAARTIKSAWDKAVAENPCVPGPCKLFASGTTPPSLAFDVFKNGSTYLPLPNPGICTADPDTTTPICFQAAPGQPFSTPTAQNDLIEIKLIEKGQPEQLTSLQKFVAKLDRFFGREPDLNRLGHVNKTLQARAPVARPSFLGWLLGEKQALANYVFAAAAPDCKANSSLPGCAEAISTNAVAGWVNPPIDPARGKQTSIRVHLYVCRAAWSGQCADQYLRISTGLPSTNFN